MPIMIGNLIVLVSIPIGILGVYFNLRKMYYGEGHNESGTIEESVVGLTPVVEPLA